MTDKVIKLKDITDDTTWYLIDSPIKVNPTDPSDTKHGRRFDYRTGVEIIIGENKGISFDGGFESFVHVRSHSNGTETEPITFNADRSLNPMLSGMVWSQVIVQVQLYLDKCKCVISNTNHVAINNGSRPADPNGPVMVQATKIVMLESSLYQTYLVM